MRLQGALDVAVLALALAEVVSRHEALRMVFLPPEAGDDEPAQRVLAALAVAVPLLDLAALPPAAREAEARRLAAVEARRPFDLAGGPLLRAAVVRLASDDHILVLTLHHIVSDGWSLGVLVREVAALYAAFSQRLPSPLPPLAVQYADYAAWQRGWLRGPVLEGQIDRPAAAADADLPRRAVDAAGSRRSRGGGARPRADGGRDELHGLARRRASPAAPSLGTDPGHRGLAHRQPRPSGA